MTILDAVATMKEAERVIARLMAENDALVARVAELEAALMKAGSTFDDFARANSLLERYEMANAAAIARDAALNTLGEIRA